MKKMLKLFGLLLVLTMFFSVSALANENDYWDDDLIGADQSEFEQLISEIQTIKVRHPEYTDEMILEIIDEKHHKCERGIADTWNALTDSEKKFVSAIPLMP